MFVDGSDAGIAKQYASAAVWLQPVFVRINDDGIRLADQIVTGACLGVEIADASVKYPPYAESTWTRKP